MNSNEQLKIYCEYTKELVDETGKIRPASSNIFKTLSEKLGMTQKAIHLVVTNKSMDIFGFEYKKAGYRDENSDPEDELFSKDNFGVTVSIQLFEADRFSFDFVTVEGPKRNYNTLRPGWSNKLFSIIVRETKSECCYAFKKVDIIGSEFSTKVNCAECLGTVFVNSQQNRSKLMLQIVDSEIPHTFTKKRRLAKERAANLIDDLNHDMDGDLDKLPRDFVGHKSLQNLKYRSNAKRDSAITELRKMKNLPQYNTTIKEVCCDPFRVMFWSKEQIFCFCQLKKNQRVILSFDATGGLVSRTSLTQDVRKFFETPPEIPHIFLYLICMKNEHGVSVPLGQMISASQDSVKISFFLSKWISEFCSPHEFIVDDSKALHKAILLSCTLFQTGFKEVIHKSRRSNL